MYDILIRNGTIIDGTGEARYTGDIAIKGKFIEKIGNLEQSKAIKILDAPNLFVVPGFIDITNHSDTYLSLFTNPSQESLLRQGITSIIGGSCGASLAPLISRDGLGAIQKWSDTGTINLNWHSVKEMFRALETAGMTLNFGTLVGHETLRRGVAGDNARNLNAREMLQVKQIFKESIGEGAFGFSAGLAYAHTKHTSLEELAAFAKIAEERGAVCAIHLRDEGKHFLGSVNEVIQIAKETSATMRISHLKVHHPYWKYFENALQMIDDANTHGTNIHFDIYPYAVSATHLYTMLPDAVLIGEQTKGKYAILKKLKEKEVLDVLLPALREERYTIERIVIASIPHYRNMIGKNILELATQFKKTPEEMFLEIILAGELTAIGFVPSLSRENIKAGYLRTNSFVSSNGAGYAIERAVRGDELIHPRSFGAFPKFFHEYCYAREILSPEEAIKKMTLGPAEHIGIARRGKITKGYFADIAIINPRTFKDAYTFGESPRYATGVEHLIINGELAIEHKEFKNRKAGVILKK